jgi:hypothetical protein
MAHEIIINIEDQKKPPVLKFPPRCVRCARPQETTIKVSLNMGVQKRSKPVMMENIVPMCITCAERERSIAKVTLVPFIIAGLIVFIIVFIPIWMITPDGTMPQTLGFSIVVGAFVGLIAGVIAGTLVEFGLKFVFAPLYGQLLLKRPLTVFSVFNDSEDIIGLSFKFGEQKKTLKLIFENEDIARDFGNLNL